MNNLADFYAWLDLQREAALEALILESRFWRMTTAEVMERLLVHRKRQEQEMFRAAWMTHHIMAAFVGSKKAPTISQLLGHVEKVSVT